MNKIGQFLSDSWQCCRGKDEEKTDQRFEYFLKEKLYFENEESQPLESKIITREGVLENPRDEIDQDSICHQVKEVPVLSGTTEKSETVEKTKESGKKILIEESTIDAISTKDATANKKETTDADGAIENMQENEILIAPTVPNDPTILEIESINSWWKLGKTDSRDLSKPPVNSEEIKALYQIFKEIEKDLNNSRSKCIENNIFNISMGSLNTRKVEFHKFQEVFSDSNWCFDINGKLFKNVDLPTFKRFFRGFILSLDKLFFAVSDCIGKYGDYRIFLNMEGTLNDRKIGIMFFPENHYIDTREGRIRSENTEWIIDYDNVCRLLDPYESGISDETENSDESEYRSLTININTNANKEEATDQRNEGIENTDKNNGTIETVQENENNLIAPTILEEESINSWWNLGKTVLDPSDPPINGEEIKALYQIFKEIEKDISDTPSKCIENDIFKILKGDANTLSVKFKIYEFYEIFGDFDSCFNINGKPFKKVDLSNFKCFFRGFILSLDKSFFAVSNCIGKGGDYSIYPNMNGILNDRINGTMVKLFPENHYIDTREGKIKSENTEWIIGNDGVCRQVKPIEEIIVQGSSNDSEYKSLTM